VPKATGGGQGLPRIADSEMAVESLQMLWQDFQTRTDRRSGAAAAERFSYDGVTLMISKH